MENKTPEYFASLAKEKFLDGYNCAQSVVAAFAQEDFFINSGLTEKTAILAVSGFGGGMGRLREVCGTVTGMFFVASLKQGYYPADDKTVNGELKKKHYELIQRLAKKFADKNGSIICRELLGLTKKLNTDAAQKGSLPGSDTPVPEARTEGYYKKRPCPELCALAAKIVAEEIL